MSNLESHITDILAKRFVELFSVALKAPLLPAREGIQDAPFTAPLFHATIALKGEKIDATLIVSADKKFLHETHPERRYGGSLDQTDYLDWIAEIANRTLAGSKAQLAQLGLSLKLEQPKAALGFVGPAESAEKEIAQVFSSAEFYAMISLKIRSLDAKESKAS